MESRLGVNPHSPNLPSCRRKPYFFLRRLKSSAFTPEREEMNKLISAKMIYALIAVVLVIAVFLVYKRQAGQVKVSEFGKYQGYSEAIYDGTKRISDYLTLSNGTKLAYDLILPTKKGVPADDHCPSSSKYTPYRAPLPFLTKLATTLSPACLTSVGKKRPISGSATGFDKRGNLMDAVFRTKYLENMLKHGYAVIVVERPGTGASFGVMNASFEVGAKEVNEILNWIAAQDWCNGNIGMYGDSFQAMIQFAAAATGNPHLKALFPTSSGFDMYSCHQLPGRNLQQNLRLFFLLVNILS